MATTTSNAPSRTPMTSGSPPPTPLGTRQATAMQAPPVAPAARAVRKWVKVMRWIFFIGVWVILAAIVAQLILIGRFLFTGASLDAHAAVGWITAHNLGPLVLIVSAFTRMGWKMHTMATVALVVLALTPIVATWKYVDNATLFGASALHPTSAILVFTLLLLVVQRQGAFVRSPVRTAAPKPGPAAGRVASPPA